MKRRTFALMILGVAALGESVFGVELATNEALSGSARVLRGVHGGSQIVIFVGGPQALRNARERSAALRAVAVGAVAETATLTGRALPVLNPEFVPRPHLAQPLLQRIVTNETASLAADFSRAKSVFRLREHLAGTVPSRLNPARFGQAVERLVGLEIRGDPLLRRLFDPAGISRRGPDIVGIGPFAGLTFDITTSSSRAIAQHLARPYGQNLIIITYDRPTTFTVFPP